MNDTVVTYQGQQVSVPKEVADFLERDRRRMRAQDANMTLTNYLIICGLGQEIVRVHCLHDL